MSQSITKAITRPGVIPAFLAGLGVFVLLLAIGFVQTLLSALGVVTRSGAQSVGQIWGYQLLASLAGPLPFAIGVFLCFWQLAPIAPVLRLAHVVTRSILAALLGAAVTWVVLFAELTVAAIASSPFTFHPANVFGTLATDALAALFSALALSVGYLPSVALAAILLWGWLQQHPHTTPVHGAVDEV